MKTGKIALFFIANSSGCAETTNLKHHWKWKAALEMMSQFGFLWFLRQEHFLRVRNGKFLLDYTEGYHSEMLNQRQGRKLDYEEKAAEDEDDTLCGVLSWRPSWLQRFANLGTFTFVLSVINLLNGIFNTYFNAVITSIENRFGLSSSMMGFLKNVDNIGYLCSIMIISHFCRYANKTQVVHVCMPVFCSLLLFSSLFLTSSTVQDHMWISIN